MAVTIYAGLAGDTDPGRFVSAGLYRSHDDGPWQCIDAGFAPPPEVYAIASDPGRPGRVTLATQRGIFRSEDEGDSWAQLAAPAPLLAVWSLLRHPADPGVMLAGYEPCAIWRTGDDGQTWQELPVAARYPDISNDPDMPKRVTGLAFAPANPQEMYASIEIGGLLRSLDGGEHWEAAIDGVYVSEDAVDVHAVAVSLDHPGRLTIATRVGAFRSDDRGDHWRKLPVPALREKGSYCRALAYAPSQPDRLYLGAGNDFDGDRGALFVSDDDGDTWRAAELPGPLKGSVFAIAVNPRLPGHLACATKNGGVFVSVDGGLSWRYAPLPRGAGHVFSLALG